MLKIAGMIMILIACAGAGRLRAYLPRKRQMLLRGAQQGLLSLMREMSYAVPISQALSNASAAAAQAGWLFQGTSDLLAEGRGITAGEAWAENIRNHGMDGEDAELLMLIGDGLGLSDNEDQRRRLELLRQRLAEAEEKSALEAEKYGKIWRAMGWSCGAVLALLLL